MCLSSSSDSEQVALDRLPIDAMPANRPIRVRFSQNMDPATLTLGESCGSGGVRVERIDQSGVCQGTVPGVLQIEPRAISFVPDQPWEEGALYRYTLASESNGCTGDALCSEAGLPCRPPCCWAATAPPAARTWTSCSAARRPIWTCSRN